MLLRFFLFKTMVTMFSDNGKEDELSTDWTAAAIVIPIVLIIIILLVLVYVYWKKIEIEKKLENISKLASTLEKKSRGIEPVNSQKIDSKRIRTLLRGNSSLIDFNKEIR